MDKRRLLDRLASAFGKKAAGPTEPAPPEAEPVEPVEPPASAPTEPSGDVECQPIGEIMPPVGPEIPADERLAQSLADAVDVTERAGRMLEVQAKQQQQATDAVAELSGMVRSLSDQVAADGEALGAIRTQLSRSGEVTERLAEQLDDAAAKLSTAGGDGARLSEGLIALSRTVEQLMGTMAEQGRNQRNAMAELNNQLRKGFSRLRWLVLAAIVLAAAAVAAPFVVTWF